MHRNLLALPWSRLLRSTVGPVHSLHRSISRAVVPLTSEVTPDLTRGDYATVTDSDLATFERLLTKSRVLTEDNDVDGFNTDWMRKYKGASRVVLQPKTTEEVSAILDHCNKRRLAVVPQGGNTGLVGGSVPVFDEIVLSTGLMNRILEVNDISGISLCQSGVILEQLDDHLSQHGLCMPLDLAAKGSCQIGGNVATNAGGVRLLRYGSLHGSVLGLEAVLPDGEVLDCLSPLRKDNTGYDLKQLFIGSEGTLGVITKVAILCPPRPLAVNVAFFGCETFDQALKTFACARRKLSEVLSAFEFMDSASMKCVNENMGLANPLSEYPFYLLVETAGSSQEHDQAKLNHFLDTVMNEGLVSDGVVAQDATQVKRLWTVRESGADACLREAAWLMLDVSFAVERTDQLLDAAAQELKRLDGGHSITMSAFGHVGDGNLHLNFTTKDAHNKEVLSRLEPFIFAWLRDHRGSISAEHGLGLAKAKYIHYSKPPTAVNYMRRIKAVFDPNNIMNPYKYLPPAQ